MAHAEETVVVPREIDHVFAFLADGLNEPLWRPDVTTVSLTTPGNQELGAVWGQTMRGPGGRTIAGDYRITAYAPPTRLDFEVIAGPARPIGSFRLREVDATSTELTFVLDLVPQGLMRLMTPMINRQVASEARAIHNVPTAMADWMPLL